MRTKFVLEFRDISLLSIKSIHVSCLDVYMIGICYTELWRQYLTQIA